MIHYWYTMKMYIKPLSLYINSSIHSTTVFVMLLCTCCIRYDLFNILMYMYMYMCVFQITYIQNQNIFPYKLLSIESTTTTMLMQFPFGYLWWNSIVYAATCSEHLCVIGFFKINSHKNVGKGHENCPYNITA